MRCLSFVYLLFLSLVTYAQSRDSVNLSVFNNEKEVDIELLKIYAIKDKTAVPINIEGGILNISQFEGNTTTLLLMWNSKKILFDINPKEMFYLKIERKSNGLFNPEYVINQGFDHVDVVNPTKKTFKIKE